LSTVPPPLSSRDRFELVEELSHLTAEERTEQFRRLPPDRQVEVFQQLHPAHQDELLQRLDDERISSLLESLDPDDRVQLFEQVPQRTADDFYGRLSARERAMTDELLQYPESSAGRIMSPEFLALSPAMTADEALAAIRTRGRGVETVVALPVTDEAGRLLGMTTLDEVVLAEPGARVRDFMETDVPVVRADEDQEVVARLVQFADVMAIPVVDAENRLLGLVTVDDAMDVIEFEESEDLARTGAAEPLGRPYFAVSVFRLMRSRVVWLFLLALAATLTVNVLSAFESLLDEIVSLSLFIPLLIGVGGNAGAQSATTIVRAMAVNDVRFSDLFRVIFREARVGLLLGAALAAVAFPLVSLFFGQALAIVISLSLVTICTLASLVGSTMPILADRVGVDPAVVSAPFVTTIVDATGLLVYFLIARAVLNV
jgi:magnesium transporter